MAQNDTRNWSGKSRGGILGYLIFINIIKCLGVRTAYFLLSFVVIYFIPFAPSATRSIWKFSRKILRLGYLKSSVLIYKNFYSLGRALIDKVAVNQGKYAEYTFDFAEPDDVKRVLNSNQGVIIIGAHFGNWEIGAPFFGKYGKKMNVLMMDKEYQSIKKILEVNKSIDAFGIIPIEGDSLEYIFKIRDALAKGEYISIQGDRLSRSDKHHDLEFMGKTASFPLGPFVLAARMNAPVVFYFAEHTGYKRYKFDFILSDYTNANGGKEKDKEKLLLGEYVALLSERVREYPEQWYNYFDFWKYER